MVKPKGVRANSWQDVADVSASFGVGLDPWQELILEAAMGERSDRTWAAKRVGVSVPRQNGKSQLLVARALAGALVFGEKKIVISAHQQDTARESFAKLMEIIEDDGNSLLRDRVKSVMNALNREAVRFSNGAVIQFKARSGAAGKGFSSDCLLLDEAQILGSRSWTSINSTMSAMLNPQVWLLGTPPQDEDDSYAFDMVRRAAIEGKSTAATWCEWAADPTADDYDPASEYTRWSANPAWLTRPINAEVVQGEYETYDPDRFAQDRLGIWRGEQAMSLMPSWADRGTDAPPTSPAAIGIAVSIDRAWSSIGAASADRHLGAVKRARGTDWVVAEAKRISTEHGVPVVIAGRGPGASLIEALKDAGVDPIVAGVDDYQDACASVFDGVESGAVSHANYPDLNDAVLSAKWTAGERRTFTRKGGDVSMLEAVTLADWGAQSETESVYESRGMVVL